MINNNIIIETTSGERLDYTSPESLNITFNRIADDYREPDKRFGEFSYSFSLPKTKRNAKIFKYADKDKVQRKFKVNPINIVVYNNDQLLLSGILVLEGFTNDSYDCRFYSKLTQLTDSLEDLDLNMIDTMPIIEWDEETTIANHINANYLSSDEVSYQFPLVFYNTYFTPYSVYSGETDFTGVVFRADGDRPQQNHYYILNRTATGTDNEFYHHQFPLCFYLKSALEGLLEYVGWSLSGSFWETDEAKKMIMLYYGENDIYDQARFSSGATTYLDTNKFLPKLDSIKFIQSIINMFNLYLQIDLNNRIIKMETYDKMFGQGVAPYNIDNKIDEATLETESIDEYDISLLMEDANNTNHLGDNYYIGSSGDNAKTASYIKTSNTPDVEVFNYLGTTDGEIEIDFAAPKVKRMYIKNNENFLGTVSSANEQVLYVPDMSEQTQYDNKNNKFNKASGDTTVFNDESSVKFKGKPTIMYYYGVSSSDFVQETGKGPVSDYFYVDFNNTKQKIGIASPFGYQAYRNNINDALDNAPSGSSQAMYASYLQSIYLNMGDNFSGNYRYSLVFGDNYGLIDTLYSKFYQNRMTRYRDSEIVNAEIRLNDYDWDYMKLNQPLLYRDEIYSLVAIEDYDVINSVAKISMIRQI